jgi:hypothetical protein
LTFTSDLESTEKASNYSRNLSVASISSLNDASLYLHQIARYAQDPSNTPQLMRESSVLKIRGQNLDEDVIQRYPKPPKTRLSNLDVESDEVDRREDETVIALVPEESPNADLRYRLISMRLCLQSQAMQPTSQTISSHNGQISL